MDVDKAGSVKLTSPRKQPRFKGLIRTHSTL
jgi:hypothetical protein